MANNETNLDSWLKHLPEAYAYHQVLTDEAGEPVDYLFLQANPAFETMTGLKVKDIIGRRLTEVMPGIESGDFDWIGTFGQVALTGESCQVEQYSQPLDRWYSVTAYSDEPGCFATLFHDITKQKEKEEKLEQTLYQQQQERDLFSAGPVLTISWEPGYTGNVPTGNVLYVSKNVTEILGYTPEEMTRCTFAYGEILHPEDLEKVRSESIAHRKSGVHRYNQSYRLKTKSGAYRWFYDQTQCITNTAGEIIEHIGYLVDQTPLKEAEKYLEKERQRLADIIEGTHVGTWEWNVQTGENRINVRWAEMIGYEKAEIDESIDIWEKLMHPEDLVATKKHLEKVFKKAEQRYSVEFRLKHKNGHWIWIQTRGKVLSWTLDGKPLMISGTHTDVTQRKQTEEALKLAKQQAETANRAKSRYLAHMNHEMRTPLNGFLGFVQLMESTRLDEDQQEFMEHMKHSATNLLGIINNVLDMASIEAGQIKLESRVFLLEEEIETALAPLRYLAPHNNTHLKVTMDEHLPRQVKGDPDRLRQIILNLGGNGVKFTHNGQVHIALTCPETTGDHHTLELVVEDTGPGMTEETLDKLFQPFYQADDGSVPQSKGTGLGLTITKELVELMGGTIQVDSTLGKGTRMSVTLKLQKA